LEWSVLLHALCQMASSRKTSQLGEIPYRRKAHHRGPVPNNMGHCEVFSASQADPSDCFLPFHLRLQKGEKIWEEEKKGLSGLGWQGMGGGSSCLGGGRSRKTWTLPGAVWWVGKVELVRVLFLIINVVELQNTEDSFYHYFLPITIPFKNQKLEHIVDVMSWPPYPQNLYHTFYIMSVGF
jgi:hypothetical protein